MLLLQLARLPVRCHAKTPFVPKTAVEWKATGEVSAHIDKENEGECLDAMLYFRLIPPGVPILASFDVDK